MLGHNCQEGYETISVRTEYLNGLRSSLEMERHRVEKLENEIRLLKTDLGTLKVLFGARISALERR